MLEVPAQHRQPAQRLRHHDADTGHDAGGVGRAHLGSARDVLLGRLAFVREVAHDGAVFQLLAKVQLELAGLPCGDDVVEELVERLAPGRRAVGIEQTAHTCVSDLLVNEHASGLEGVGQFVRHHPYRAVVQQAADALRFLLDHLRADVFGKLGLGRHDPDGGGTLE